MPWYQHHLVEQSGRHVWSAKRGRRRYVRSHDKLGISLSLSLSLSFRFMTLRARSKEDVTSALVDVHVKIVEGGR
jgi:hypothetical protein